MARAVVCDNKSSSESVLLFVHVLDVEGVKGEYMHEVPPGERRKTCQSENPPTPVASALIAILADVRLDGFRTQIEQRCKQLVMHPLASLPLLEKKKKKE